MANFIKGIVHGVEERKNMSLPKIDLVIISWLFMLYKKRRCFFSRFSSKNYLPIETMYNRLSQGVAMRIDEYREMIELLQDDLPGLMRQCPEIYRNLRALDYFLVQLEMDVHQKRTIPGFPRPWPQYQHQQQPTLIKPFSLTNLSLFTQLIYIFANLDFYESRLLSLQREAGACGYFFARARKTTIIQPDLAASLTQAIVSARTGCHDQHITATVLNELRDQNMFDGHPQTTLQSILVATQPTHPTMRYLPKSATGSRRFFFRKGR